VLAATALVTAALALGCAPTADAPATTTGATPSATRPAAATVPDRLVVAIPTDVRGFDAAAQDSLGSNTLLGVIGEPLVSLGNDFVLRPRLATEWDVGDEGRTLTFRLREGVTFHDGRPFTSDDVRYTIESVQAADQAMLSGMLRIITSVETPDPLTVVLRVSDPLRGMLITLATVPIVPATSGADASARPIGTGPFAFVRHDAGTALLVERFDQYWGGASDVASIEFRVIADSADRARALVRGAAHLSQSQWAAADERSLDSDRNVNVQRTEGVSYQYLAINPARAPFDDVDVRRALNHLIPRERIVSDVFEGRAFPATSLLVPSMPWYDPDATVYAYDVDRARELVATADAAGFDRTYTVLTNDSPIRNAIAEVLVDTFAQIGLRVEVETLDFSTFLSRINGGDFDMYLLGLAQTYNVTNLLAGSALESGFSNRVGFNDPEAEAWLREAAGLDPTSDEAVALYRQVANRLVSYSASAFLTHTVVTGATRAEVEGWSPHPLAELAYQDLHQVRLRR